MFFRRKENPKPLESNFSLLDVLISEVLLLDLERMSQAEHRLTNLLKDQLKSFFLEDKRAPYHTYAAEADISKLSEGRLQLFGRHYHRSALVTASADMLEQAKKATLTHTGEKQKRYQKEQTQLEGLYTHFRHDLTHWEQIKQPATAQILPSPLREQEQLQDDEEIFVGTRLTTALPINQQVYPEAMAYQNLFQIVYLPRKQKYLVLIEQLFGSFSLEDHTRMFSQLTQQPRVKKPTENTLMKLIAPLPPALQTVPGWELFLEAGSEVFAKKDQNARLQLLARQQMSLGKLKERHKDIEQCAAFLTQILLMNAWLCTYNPKAIAELPARLRSAFDIVGNSLLQEKPFVYEVALANYHEHWGIFRDFLSPSRHPSLTQASQEQLNQRLKSNHRLLQMSFTPETVRSLRQQAITAGEKEKHNSLLSGALSHMPHLANRVLSGLDCTLGSYGGLLEAGKALELVSHQTDFLTNPLRLGDLIGHERVKDWRMGICIRERTGECVSKHTGKQRLIGECGLCYECELSFATSGVGDGEKKSRSLSEFFGESFTHPLDTLAGFQRNIEAGYLLPMYLMPESVVFR